jgi:thioredoxin-dependent peroxiredoxin
MTLSPGDQAPDFALPDQTGTERSLADLLAGGPVVLFWYPAAMTTGCTKEACHFRDIAAEFEAVGAQRVGISADAVEKQAEFDEKHSLGYPLLSDKDKSVAKAYGVKRTLLPMNKRVTFVIGQDGKLVDVISSETNMDVHADKALEALRG